MEVQIDPNKVGKVIGSGGATIKSIIEETGVTNIDIGDDGLISVSSTDDDKIEAAIARISA